MTIDHRENEMSENFLLVANGLVALHQLGRNGNDDSPEAEAIRDSLDVPLGALNQVEKERARWLSEDLYSVSEPGEPTARTEDDSQVDRLFELVDETRTSRDWDRAFEALRRSESQVSPSRMRHLRGLLWAEAGIPQVAAMFRGNPTGNNSGDTATSAPWMGPGIARQTS